MKSWNQFWAASAMKMESATAAPPTPARIPPKLLNSREITTMQNKDFSLNLQIEPISDEILESVLGGIGDEDGISNSCSSSGCSNKTVTQ